MAFGGSTVFVFAAGVAVSLGASWVLVSRIERVGARLGLSEALLGMAAALAADGPEITAAVTALVRHQDRVGAGVVIGSNVFNLAALLGLTGLIAGWVPLHRRVIVLEGVVAVWVALACLVTVTGGLAPGAALGLVLAVFVPYLLILGVRPGRLRRLGLPDRWVRWLRAAVAEEELELAVWIHPRRGRAADWIVGGVATLVVIGASVAMEQSATTLGTRHGIPEILIGALVLAAVTSLPNAVAALFLAARGRGEATLSTALNSNTLNVLAGLLLPATLLGLGAATSETTFVAACYLALTAFALAAAFATRGLRRDYGVVIVFAYLVFVCVLVGVAYGSRLTVLTASVLLAGGALTLAARRRLRRPEPRNGTRIVGTSEAPRRHRDGPNCPD